MGNCLIRNNQISAQDDDEQPRESEVELKKKTTSGSSSESEEPAEESMKKKRIKKKVRFELQKDEEAGRKEVRRRSGSVRIKLVVTQQELERILSHKNDTDQQRTALEQLLSSVKLRGSRRIGQVIGEDDRAINGWRPSLESIPEDQ